MPLALGQTFVQRFERTGAEEQVTDPGVTYYQSAPPTGWRGVRAWNQRVCAHSNKWSDDLRSATQQVVVKSAEISARNHRCNSRLTRPSQTGCSQCAILNCPRLCASFQSWFSEDVDKTFDGFPGRLIGLAMDLRQTSLIRSPDRVFRRYAI